MTSSADLTPKLVRMRSYSTRASLRTWAHLPESLCTAVRQLCPLHGTSLLGMGSCTFWCDRGCVSVSPTSWLPGIGFSEPASLRVQGARFSAALRGEANWDVIYLGEEVVTGFLGELPCGSPTWSDAALFPGTVLNEQPFKLPARPGACQADSQNGCQLQDGCQGRAGCSKWWPGSWTQPPPPPPAP